MLYLLKHTMCTVRNHKRCCLVDPLCSPAFLRCTIVNPGHESWLLAAACGIVCGAKPMYDLEVLLDTILLEMTLSVVVRQQQSKTYAAR